MKTVIETDLIKQIIDYLKNQKHNKEETINNK